MSDEILLSMDQAARVLGCSDQAVRNWVKAGRLHQVADQGKAQVRLVELRGLPKKRVFSDRDIDKVARRIGQQTFVRAAG